MAWFAEEQVANGAAFITAKKGDDLACADFFEYLFAGTEGESGHAGRVPADEGRAACPRAAADLALELLPAPSVLLRIEVGADIAIFA